MRFVLHGTTSLSLALDDTRTPAPTTAPIAKAKPTELTTLIDMMKQAISKLGTLSALAPQAKPPALAPRDHRCHFCGGDHWKSSCEVLKEYIRDRKCILCDDGRIVLPGGCFIPGSVAGKTFRERLDEWYRQNLVSTSTANVLLLDVSPNPTVNVLQLSSEERILSLEKELFALRAHDLAPGVRMRAQKARDPNPPADAPTPAKGPMPPPAPAPVAPVTPPVPAARLPPHPSATPEEVNDDDEPPVHPFARAKDAAYAPPTTNNVAAKPKPAPLKKPDIPLRTVAPVYDAQVASAVYACTMDSQITITQRELLLLSLEVRNQVCNVTSNRRIVRTDTPLVPVEQNLLDVFAHIEVTDDEDDHARREVSRLATMPATYSTAVLSPTMKTLTPDLSNTEPPPGAIIIEDPYEVYLRTAPEDRGSDCLTVTKESSALHTILPLINHNQYIKSVLNPGSQVIAMSEAACHALALIYDPRIRLHMQLANCEVDETLGLARNVPILVGDITLYVQFHII